MQRAQLQVLLILLLAFSWAKLDGKAQSADSLVFQIAETYKDLKVYHFEGETEVRIRRGYQTQESSFSVQMAERFPTHFRVQVGGEQARTLVYNADSTWAFHPPSGEYIARPGRLQPGPQRTDFPDFFNAYKRLDEITDRTQIISADTTYELGNEQRRVFFLELILKPDPQNPGASNTMLLWVDRDRGVVLQERSSRYIPTSPAGPVSLRRTTSFRIASVNEGIPDSLFTFEPPENTRAVTEIVAFPNLPVTLHGRQVDPFSLPALHAEEELSLSRWQGRVIVLNFWATWCAPCRAEMSALNRLQKQGQSEGLTVLAINVEELPEPVRSYIEEEGLDFTVLLDQFGLVSRQFSVEELPTTFVIDRSGIIRDHMIGARTEADFRKAIEAVL